MRIKKIGILVLAAAVLAVMTSGMASAEQRYSYSQQTYVADNGYGMYLVYDDTGSPVDETISAGSGETLTLPNHFWNTIAYTLTSTSWTKSSTGAWKQAGSTPATIPQWWTSSGDNSGSSATGSSGNTYALNVYHEYIRPGYGSYSGSIETNKQYYVT